MKRVFLITVLIMIIFAGHVSAQMYGGAITHSGPTLPPTCKDIGTLFWDTDNDRLYICDPANTWTEAGGVTLLDEDDFESNSATQGATQQSIKAYVDDGLLGKADVSILGSSLNSDDLINNGGVLELNSKVPHTDDEHEWEAVQTFMDMTLKKRSSAPASPVQGTIYYADGVIWDPSGLNLGIAYYVLYDGTNYRALLDEEGAWHLSYVPLPTYNYTELEDGTDPGADGYDLTQREVKGFVITNAGLSASKVWNFPAREEGWNFIFIKEADYDVELVPNGTENWYFRTDSSAYELNGAGVSLVNTTSGKSTLSCFATESAVYCTGDVNWTQGS